MKPDISIIITTYNRRKAVRSCINSLINQKYSNGKYEIIVVDNGSTDGTLEMLGEYKKEIKVIHLSKPGYATSRNSAFGKAQADIIAITDSDCVVSPTWASELVDTFKKSDDSVAVIGGLTLADPKQTLVAQVDQEIVNYGITKYQTGNDVYYLPSCNIAFRKKILKEIGLFDIKFDPVGGEDTEFCWRVIKSGKKIKYFNKRMKVFHSQRDTVISFLNQHYNYGRGVYLIRKLHLDFMVNEVKKNRFLRYIDELYQFPKAIAKNHSGFYSKFIVIILVILRQAFFYIGIIKAKIDHGNLSS